MARFLAHYVGLYLPNLVNFGSQMAEITWRHFTHPWTLFIIRTNDKRKCYSRTHSKYS